VPLKFGSLSPDYTASRSIRQLGLKQSAVAHCHLTLLRRIPIDSRFQRNSCLSRNSQRTMTYIVFTDVELRIC